MQYVVWKAGIPAWHNFIQKCFLSHRDYQKRCIYVLMAEMIVDLKISWPSTITEWLIYAYNKALLKSSELVNHLISCSKKAGDSICQDGQTIRLNDDRFTGVNNIDYHKPLNVVVNEQIYPKEVFRSFIKSSCK